MFIVTMVLIFFTAACMHPREFTNIIYGCVFFLMIPSTYVFLSLYSLINPPAGSGVVTVTQQLYFAAPLNQAAGATYQAYAANPLQTTDVPQITCFFADLQPNADHTNPALCDDDVDIADVQRVAGCWNQAPGSQACPATLDTDRDMDIDSGDIGAVAGQWGWSR